MPLFSKKKLLDIYSFVMYLFDTGSDVLVSIGLINSCHYFFGASTLCLVFLPGFVYGWYHKFVRTSVSNIGFEAKGSDSTLRAILAPLWFVPYTIRKLFRAILKTSDEAGEKIAFAENDAKL